MRIVSLLASGTEIVCGLGAGKDLGQIARMRQSRLDKEITGLHLAGFRRGNVEPRDQCGGKPANQSKRAALLHRRRINRTTGS